LEAIIRLEQEQKELNNDTENWVYDDNKNTLTQQQTQQQIKLFQKASVYIYVPAGENKLRVLCLEPAIHKLPPNTSVVPKAKRQKTEK